MSEQKIVTVFHRFEELESFETSISVYEKDGFAVKQIVSCLIENVIKDFPELSYRHLVLTMLLEKS